MTEPDALAAAAPTFPTTAELAQLFSAAAPAVIEAFRRIEEARRAMSNIQLELVCNPRRPVGKLQSAATKY